MFIRKTKKIVVFEGVRGNVLRLIGKLVGDFLLVIIELFFARCFRFVTIHAFDRRTDGRTDGRAHRKDRVAYNAAQ